MSQSQEILRDKLTPEQYNAATDSSQEVLALACAGSGKSRTLAYRTAKLIADGEPPESIVAFTFTEKAAESIKRSVSKALVALGLDPLILGAVYIGTIHSYCQNLLPEIDGRYRQYEVLDENRLVLYLISRYGLLNIQGLRLSRGKDPGYFKAIKELSSAWKIMHDEMVSIEAVKVYDEQLGNVFEQLWNSLDKDQFIDFSLMIRLIVDALESGQLDNRASIMNLKHLMVDEYQDINPLQERLIQELHKRSSTLFVVGDDDQAIYSWRGADVDNILTFQQRYPNCSAHSLSTNFRSTSAIVDSANHLIAQQLGPRRIQKTPTAYRNDLIRDYRKLWFNTREEEAEWVAEMISYILSSKYIEADGTERGLTPADIAILMRSTGSEEVNGDPRHAAFSRALERRGIPFSIEAGGGVFDRPHVIILREAFELLRHWPVSRDDAQEFFQRIIRVYPQANFNNFTNVLTNWGALIHSPQGGRRQRLLPQNLLYELLSAFGIENSNFDSIVMQEIGVFSKILQDVETVYVSVDSSERFAQILNFLSNVADSGYDISDEHVLIRPDAVTISTVHKVKGLEYPAVFVVDVEHRRFPGDNRDYKGWLPTQVISNAISRGAYQGSTQEEARLFYTAITRAERYLYITGAENLPGAKRVRKQSQFVLQLSNAEISTDTCIEIKGIERAEQCRRIDEAIVPTSYTEIRYYLACPQDYLFRQIFGFSPAIPDMFGYGRTVHTAISKLHEVYNDSAPTPEEAARIAEEVFHLKHVPPSHDPGNRPGAYEAAKKKSACILRTYAEQYEKDFTKRKQVEVRFEIPVNQAVIAGAIDLLVHEDDQGEINEANIVDFKTMEGGTEPLSNNDIDWTDLSLQVQLYAKASREVLNEGARTGSVHLLKDNQRVDVPIDDEAVSNAISNVEWAVDRILHEDFPRRPNPGKCDSCDFKLLCSKQPQNFKTQVVPPEIHLPSGRTKVKAFQEMQNNTGILT